MKIGTEKLGWKVFKEDHWTFNDAIWKISLIDIEGLSFIRIEEFKTPQADFPRCHVMCQVSELVGEMTTKLGQGEHDDFAHACLGISTSGDFFELLLEIQSEGEVI